MGRWRASKDIDRLLDRASDSEPSEARVGQFLRALRSRLLGEPPREVASRHLEMIHVAVLDRDGFSRDELGIRRARRQSGPSLRSTAVAALVAFVMLSGLAAAGTLPSPVQRAVADTARFLGITIPVPDDLESNAADSEVVPMTPAGSPSPTILATSGPSGATRYRLEGAPGALPEATSGQDHDGAQQAPTDGSQSPEQRSADAAAEGSAPVPDPEPSASGSSDSPGDPSLIAPDLGEEANPPPSPPLSEGPEGNPPDSFSNPTPRPPGQGGSPPGLGGSPPGQGVEPPGLRGRPTDFPARPVQAAWRISR